MIIDLLDRIRAVWHHYSTWALAALLAVGSLQEYVPQVQEYLPRWVVAGIAIAGLIGKLVPQNKPDNTPTRSYMDYRRDLPR